MNRNEKDGISLEPVEEMEDLEAGNVANAAAGNHFSMPGAVPDKNNGSNGAPQDPETESRIDGKDDNVDDDGTRTDSSTGSDQSDHRQPYYVARYAGIDLGSGPSGANNTPKGAYRRNDRFQRSRKNPSHLAPSRKLSGTLQEVSEVPPRTAGGNPGAPTSDAPVLASADPAQTTPRLGNVTRTSTLRSGTIPDSLPDEPVNGELESAVAEHNFLRGLWGQLAHVARESVSESKPRPEQRFIGFLLKNRAERVPSRRLVTYNRASRRVIQTAAPARISPSESASSVSSSEPLSPSTLPSDLSTRKSISMRPARAKATYGSTSRQRTFTPTRTPVHSISMQPDMATKVHSIQPLVSVAIGEGKDSVKNNEKVFPEKPPVANGVPSTKEKPTVSLGKLNTMLMPGSPPPPPPFKSTASAKSQKPGGKLGPNKWEEPSEWDDGLIYGYRLDGNGGAKHITLADWITNPGTPEEPVWIHLNGMCAPAHKWLWEESGLERLVVEALTADDARPRSSSFNFGTLFVIRAVNTGGTPEDMVSVRLFLQPELLVTVRRRELAAEDDVMEPLERGRGPRTAAGVAVLLLEKCTLRMGPVVSEMEDVLDSIEHAWVEKGNSEALSNDLGNLRRRVVQMRRYIQPQRDALVDLLVEDSEAPEWHEWHRQRLREVTNSTTRMMEDLAVVWERSNVLHEEMKSLAAERQGKRLYVMTMMTAVFLPLTFVTGLLGINVGGIPFRGAPTENNEGFWVTVCVCGSLVVLELLIMRGLGWMHSG